VKFASILVSDKLLLISVTRNLIILKQWLVHSLNSGSEISEILDSEAVGLLTLSEL